LKFFLIFFPYFKKKITQARLSLPAKSIGNCLPIGLAPNFPSFRSEELFLKTGSEMFLNFS